MVILSAIQPHRLLAAPPLPVTQHPCEVAPGEQPDGSQHGHMHYNMSLEDMRSQVGGEEDRCGATWLPCSRFLGLADSLAAAAWDACPALAGVLRASLFSSSCPGLLFGRRAWLAQRSLLPAPTCRLPPRIYPRCSLSLGAAASAASRPEGELRCVLAVIRHGDRTPKQKMKMKVTQEPLLALLHKYLDSKGKQAKLKVGWVGGGGCA